MRVHIVKFAILLFVALFATESGLAADPASDKVRFAVLGDPHIGVNETDNGYKMYHYNQMILSDVVAEINSMDDIDFVLIPGDMTHYSEPYNHKRFLEIIGELEVPYYLTPGNHDRKTEKRPPENWGRDEIIENYKMPWYNNSLWYGIDVAPGVHLVSMDSSNYTDHPADWNASSDPKLVWLENDLDMNKNKTVIFMTHRPLNYRMGINKPSRYSDDAPQVKKILKEHGVHLALTGHLHCTSTVVDDGLIDRSNPTTAVYPLAYTIMELNSTQVMIETIWYDNSTLRNLAWEESYKVNKCSNSIREGMPMDRNATYIFSELGNYSTWQNWTEAVLGSGNSSYNVAFELSNCTNCSVDVGAAIENVDSNLYAFVIDSGNSSAMIWMEKYNDLQDATISLKHANFEMMRFSDAYANVSVKNATISGIEAKVARGRSMRTDKEMTMAAFWLDSQKCECGPVSVGETYVEIASDLPEDVTDDLLKTIRFEKRSVKKD